MESTQKDAWEAVQNTIEAKQRLVFQVIRKREKGATLFEICQALKWPVNRVSGRVTELAKQELIFDCGEKRINPESGKKGIVWKAVNRS